MGKPMIEMNKVTVEVHFHLLEINGFFSLTLRNIIFSRMWLKRTATLAHRTPKITMKMISWFNPISSNWV